jgi:hypothetical protein
LPEADIMVITMSSDESQVLACIEAENYVREQQERSKKKR